MRLNSLQGERSEFLNLFFLFYVCFTRAFKVNITQEFVLLHTL